ncbi:uncharacterized protein [Asterias amurensis]|uniref:uncharacterized protein n=1 Tax=Asterias amurensis TaxID=7602 RepID=UPI003AB3B597
MFLGVTLLAFVSLTVCSSAELIAFPSGEELNSLSIDEAQFDPSVLDLNDNEDTGSYLFDSTHIINKRLSINYFVRDFISTETNYFRANPLLFQCLQKIQNEVSQNDEKIVIRSGYQPLQVTGGSADPSVTYRSTGSAALVGLEPGTTVTMADVVGIAVRLCVPIFQRANRDIGIVVFEETFEIRVQGSSEDGPIFSAGDDSTLSANEIQQIAWDSIDAVYGSSKMPLCPADESMSSDQIFPPDAVNPEATVGKIDHPITRGDVTDFARLTQYPGRLIAFKNEERTSDWCGEPGRHCVDCTEHMKGFNLNSRCADRTMAVRLMMTLKTLAKLVSEEWPGVKLLVIEAWDEPHDGSTYPEGDQPDDSLHYEGRAAKLALSDEDSTKLDRLAGLATCAASDYVEHKGDHIFVAVKKQAGSSATLVTFPHRELLVVVPPETDAAEYQLPDGFEGTERARPLFDKDHMMDAKLSDASIVSQFVSENGRYFRLNPNLVMCFQDIVNNENKWNPDVKVNVLNAFMTNKEHDNINFLDPRFSSPILGQSMELTYDPMNSDESTHHPERLMRQALLHCGPRFIKSGFNIGVGLYEDSVFIDMRKTFHAWVERSSLLGPGETKEDFKKEQARWLLRAVEGRDVDPLNPTDACLRSVKPKKQSPDFSHVATTTRAPAISNECVPQDNTAFCRETAKHRQEQVDRIWVEVKRKHLYHDEDELLQALQGCIGACATCKKGSFYEDKVKHCNNFLHWVPFGFLEQQDQTNFYVRTNNKMKIPACRNHCIDKTPLFSLMVPTIEALYRPDPKRSVKERLYSEVNNPSPVNELMQKLYAIHASGVVTVWVHDVAELDILKEPLKVVMLYNKNVTQVKVYATPLNQQSVAGKMTELSAEWTSGGCLDHSRTFLPPYGQVEDIPSGVSKRSPEHDLREAMLERHGNWERRWIVDHPLI